MSASRSRRVAQGHVDDLLRILSDGVASRWPVFMGQLGLPQPKIMQIERDTPPGIGRCIECLRTALLQWVVSDNPTCDVIISALRSSLFGDEELVRKVENYMESPRIQGLQLSYNIRYSNNSTYLLLQQVLM